MSHWVSAPVLLPAAGAALLMLLRRRSWSRLLALCVLALLLPLSAMLLLHSAETPHSVYILGGWPPPFGIVLVLDRLSACMLMLTALLAFPASLYTWAERQAGARFHALFLFQVAGLNAAFLTGDLFNLFVCFEILLIAAYGLLFHGAGPARSRATFTFVVLNLIGSAVFLIAAGLIFGVTGTLNLAHIGHKVSELGGLDAALFSAGALLLLLVFALKAALVPLGFWLPGAYTAARAPVAALFAIGTKVGAYAAIRLLSILLAGAGETVALARAWLLPMAMLTLLIGVIGLLGSTRLREMIAHLIVVSMGTLFATLSVASGGAFAASTYYLIHSTLATAALFLLGDLIARQRGRADDELRAHAAVRQPRLLGALFLLSAATAAGLPPFSGFVGKLLVLESVQSAPLWPWIWAAILTAGLFVILALSRAGSALFWRATERDASAAPARRTAVVAVGMLAVAGPLLALAGGPLIEYLQASGADLVDPARYAEAVLGIGKEP